jgi:ATP-dependent Lon protease
LFFLDEIDKNTTSHYDALGALYILLEPLTAKTYKDQCYPLPINTTEILWISCANEISHLNPALLSRFKTFNIGISPEQSRTIAEEIVSSTINFLAPATDGISFSAAALESLATMAPNQAGGNGSYREGVFGERLDN